MILKYSKHARERMMLRGIEEKHIVETITRGAKEFQKPDKLLSHYRFFTVVYKIVQNRHYIITVKPR